MLSDNFGSYQRSRKIAQCFTQTATVLYVNCLEENPKSEPLMVVPFIVNASFACELFLKAIAYRGGMRLEGHQLAKLLASLPVQDRECLDQAWIDINQNFNGENAGTLDSVIGELSNSFVEWRYSHERERVSAPSTVSIFYLLKVLDAASQ